MSEKNENKPAEQIGEKNLKLKDLTDFTVGEIVEESKRIDAENKQNESILDKYIRQHRHEIENAKIKNLDDFVAEEREKIEPEKIKTLKKLEKSISATESTAVEPDSQAIFTDKTISSAYQFLIGDEVEETSVSVQEEQVVPETEDIKIEEFKEINKVKSALDPVVRVDDEHDELETKKLTEILETPKELVEVLEEKTVVPSFATAQKSLSNFKPVDQNFMEKSEKSDMKRSEKSTQAIMLSANDLLLAEEKPVFEMPNKNEVSVEETESIVDETVKSTRRKPILIGVSALVLIAAIAGGFATYNAMQHPKTIQTTSGGSKTDDLTQFKTAYNKFFTDTAHTSLKNSQFDQFSALEKLVNGHKNSTAWSAAVSETQELKAEIAAINTVNNLFTKSAILDGKLDKSVQIVKDVKIPATPKTANDKLNSLLIQAIDLAKTQENTAKTPVQSAPATQTPAESDTSIQNNGSTNISNNSTSTASTSNTSSAPSNNTSNFGGLSASGVTLDNSNARLQPQAGLNPDDPAFVWADGIQEKILNICRSRGYITGDNYILVPVAIHTTNGTQGFAAGIVSGYYNLYTPDGRYLVTINDKTGYFFGNGKGLSTDF
jgi:hypothetical protein